MKRVLTVLLVVAWIAVIYWFSSQAMQETTQQTYDVLVRLGLATQTELIRSTDPSIVFLKYLIRKGAHLGLFAVLGSLTTFAIHNFSQRRGLRLIVPAWLLASLLGVADEIHQHFVPGRTMAVSDMLLDATGALLGVLFTWALMALFVRLSKKTTSAVSRR